MIAALYALFSTPANANPPLPGISTETIGSMFGDFHLTLDSLRCHNQRPCVTSIVTPSGNTWTPSKGSYLLRQHLFKLNYRLWIVHEGYIWHYDTKTGTMIRHQAFVGQLSELPIQDGCEVVTFWADLLGHRFRGIVFFWENQWYVAPYTPNPDVDYRVTVSCVNDQRWPSLELKHTSPIAKGQPRRYHAWARTSEEIFYNPRTGSWQGEPPGEFEEFDF